MRCFVSVAEHLNLTRAAEEVGVSQPAMSVQMRELERETGLELLLREKGRVSLTEQGTVMLEGFRRILSVYDESLARARSVHGGSASLVRIGYHGALTAFAALFQGLREEQPRLDVRVRVAEWQQLAEMVASGALDAALVEVHETDLRPELATVPFFTERYFCAAMSSGHPLAGRASVTVQDLQDDAVYMNGHRSASMDSMYRQLVANGLRREQIKMTESVDDAIAMVASGMGMATMPRFLAIAGNPALTWLPVSGLDFTCEIVVAWRASNPNPGLRAFVEYCGRPEVVERLRGSWPAPLGEGFLY